MTWYCPGVVGTFTVTCSFVFAFKLAWVAVVGPLNVTMKVPCCQSTGAPLTLEETSKPRVMDCPGKNVVATVRILHLTYTSPLLTVMLTALLLTTVELPGIVYCAWMVCVPALSPANPS